MLKLIIDARMSGFRARRSLALENLALHQHIWSCSAPTRNRPYPLDRLFWVLLSRLWSG
jgi:hypothetical protein